MRHKRLMKVFQKLQQKRILFLYQAFLCAAMTAVMTPVDAAAYIDPGTTGMLSQILYVLFYGALGVFFYFMRHIKQYFTNAKQNLLKWFERE